MKRSFLRRTGRGSFVFFSSPERTSPFFASYWAQNCPWDGFPALRTGLSHPGLSVRGLDSLLSVLLGLVTAPDPNQRIGQSELKHTAITMLRVETVDETMMIPFRLQGGVSPFSG